ncbi:MAG: peptide deformylase [Candidatus Omnitrophica bacterium]|nr:peptide deformylase [Candidatus Omnitrophota bacterium]
MEKTALKIKTYPDTVLRKKSLSVKEVSSRHREILSRMAQLMYEGDGVGLAAPQAGINEAMIVVDIGSGLYKLVNPKVVEASGRQINQEGCLSVPGICIKVKRAKKVRIKAFDEYGKELEIDAEGLLACVLQHEIDHLKGKLIIDYASLIERIKLGRALKKLNTNICQLNL